MLVLVGSGQPKKQAWRSSFYVFLPLQSRFVPRTGDQETSFQMIALYSLSSGCNWDPLGHAQTTGRGGRLEFTCLVSTRRLGDLSELFGFVGTWTSADWYPPLLPEQGRMFTLLRIGIPWIWRSRKALIFVVLDLGFDRSRGVAICQLETSRSHDNDWLVMFLYMTGEQCFFFCFPGGLKLPMR